MKMVTAVIKPSRLDAVLEAVTDAGASGLTVTEVRATAARRARPRSIAGRNTR